MFILFPSQDAVRPVEPIEEEAGDSESVMARRALEDEMGEWQKLTGAAESARRGLEGGERARKDDSALR